jgi:HEAT repeat protein
VLERPSSTAEDARVKRVTAWLVAVLGLASIAPAAAQSKRRFRPTPPPAEQQAVAPVPGPAPSVAPTDLRGHFGVEIAERLMRSPDPDERLQGVERLAAEHTDEALALLERAVMATGTATTDPRALLVVVRSLATWTGREHARVALLDVLRAQSLAFAPRPTTQSMGRDPAADEARGVARVALARREAAIALAELQDARVSEDLLSMGRSGEPGQQAALDALAVHPPVAPILGGVALTTPGTIALAVEVGDLRSLDAIDGAARTSDPALRAEAIRALGVERDGRAMALAHAAAHDPEADVRVAAAEALVRLGAADAPVLVQGLISDAATSREGLRLAGEVQSEDITKAAAASAVATGDEATRVAAVEALGRQTSPAAVDALTKLLGDPALQGDAAFALARSPSTAALPTLEALGASPPTRRLAARAYFVRRFSRGARSERLEALLATMVRSSDATDRAVATQALVGSPLWPLESVLDDPAPQVRRAAISGLNAPTPRDVQSLSARLGKETDDGTRALLIGALVTAGADAPVPTQALMALVKGGGPCAPLAALSLARRLDDDLAPRIDELFASSDPLLRAHVARGLAQSHGHDAVGRLAQAYAWEEDADVRRAIVEGLATMPSELGAAPGRVQTLELAARLDPDRIARWTARRALDGVTTARNVPEKDVAWLRLVAAPDASLALAATALLSPPDGLSRVIAFDPDGYAVVTGLPPGRALLRLAPRLGAYESPGAP